MLLCSSKNTTKKPPFVFFDHLEMHFAMVVRTNGDNMGLIGHLVNLEEALRHSKDATRALAG
jgi:hypothetical protein